jgi:DNA-binding transcriptional MerR regulator
MIQTMLDETILAIGDVAKIIGVAGHTIRFWEKEFDFYLNPARTQGRQRRYTELDLQKLQYVFTLLKEDGYSIAGAKRKLRQQFMREQPIKLAV